ncbi:MAG: sigma-54-dependent Fis family transcriptional regulator, partial [Pirellulales bacterium]|nr:sigma-54-dependent Fis family transcriptional regulator [Pirellulales bacterium]
AKFDERDLDLYADAVLYLLFDDFRLELQEMIESAHAGKASTQATCWRKLCTAVTKYFAPGGRELPIGYDPAHMMACFFQLRRAFFHVFFFIVGRSPAAARLRAAAWESIFTHDLRRYQRSLYRHLGDVTTLITGPSGTGKELVARAIGLSRYVPFDGQAGRFVENFHEGFQAVNLSALSPTLIESELFGHRRGAFTGAVADRVGWLESCPTNGSVFLDEIGELDPAIQVKLLRVLQSRRFQRLGDTADRSFPGKILAATNRDLVVEMAAGRFREDFYYRLCADRITTPTLREQLDECPEDLEHLLIVSARRVAPEEAEALAGEVAAWIGSHLGPSYPWPGNVRELEQCFRNVMIHGSYSPATAERPGGDEWEGTARAIRGGEWTAEELVRRYCQIVYAQCGSYEETARRTELDWRTVKKKVVGE